MKIAKKCHIGNGGGVLYCTGRLPLNHSTSAKPAKTMGLADFRALPREQQCERCTKKLAAHLSRFLIRN